MGHTILTPNVGASPIRSKVVFPSQPPQVPAPVVSTISGGTLSSRTYYFKQTWVIQTQDGTTYESTASNEVSEAIAVDYLATLTSPSSVVMPYALIGYNIYVGTTSGSETLQNSSPIDIGTNWTEPASGLIIGVAPPTTWGNELIFTYPARAIPYYMADWKGHDEYSTSGLQQSITWYVDKLVQFKMPYVASGNDASAWKQFLESAIQRVPFDFYQDSTLSTYISLILTDTKSAITYSKPGIYDITVKAREVILAT